MLPGRGRELALLDGAIAQLGSSRGNVFLFSGEPGIGKTRLASELADRATARAIRVAWGRCWEAGGAPAFWPWHEALEGLSLQFPDTAGIAASDPVEARFTLFREIARTLARATETGPVLIVLEDLHAADQSSLLLLEFLATQLRTSPILIAGTYRDLEASLRPEIAAGLARVGRASTVLALARLSAAEVAAVVVDAVESADPQLIAHVFDTTHGNPLFISELLQQVRAGTSSTVIPLGVREIIRRRLDLVSVTARRVLDAAAVLGVELAASDVIRMLPQADAELEAAIAIGLVSRRGDRIRFVHSLYREALYHDMDRATRQTLHRDAARALAVKDAPAAEIAHHLIESGPAMTADAIRQAVVAAHQLLATFAFEDAIALLERARDALPDGAHHNALRATILIALGEVRIRGGDPRGRELCLEGARLARELGDSTLLALAGLAYGSVFLVGGVDPTMVSMLEDALASLPSGDSGVRARTMARLAAARQPSPPALRARDLDLALAAVEMGRRVGSRRELLEILQSASGALYGAADPRVRMPIARQQLQLAEELGDAPRLIAAYVRLAMDHLELADLAGYEQLAKAYARVAERFGAAAGAWRIPLMYSMVALSKDDFASSERHQAQAGTIDPGNARAQRARALHRICFLRAAERHGELRASIAELRSLWSALPYGGVLADARVASSLMRIGDDDEVRRLVATLPNEVFEEEINIASLAEAIWCTADRGQAERVLPHLRRYRNRWTAYWLDVEIVEFPIERSIAYMAAIAGDWAGCDRDFETALAGVERLGRRSSVARMKFELGDLLVRCGGDEDRGRRLLEQARAGAAELGLDELVALIDRRHAPRPIAHASARPAFTIVREGELYVITTARSTLRFKATRGFQYLASLIERAGADVHVLELVGSLDADRGDAGELVDRRAMHAYRERVDALRDVLEDAEARGDVDAAEHARNELDAVATELSRGARPGGKSRRAESAVDRARSAVQRRIKDAIDRIEAQDPGLGAWLRKVVRTGNYCCFQGSL
ncbi:MAG: AAA family ATPase [Kofleriaceae bacterium]